MNIKTVLLIIFAIAVLLLIFLLLFQKKRKGIARRSKYIDALYSLIDGDLVKASKLLTAAVKHGETDTSAYLLLGDLLREQGEAEKALQIHMGLSVRKDLNPEESLKVQVSMADDFASLGRIEKASKTLEQLAKKNKSKEILYRLHTYYHRLNDYERSAEVLKELSKYDKEITRKNIASYLISIADDLYERGETDKSKEFIDRALKVDKNCPSAILFLGKIAMEEHDIVKASKMWEKLLNSDIGYFEDVKSYLETSFYEGGDFDALEEMLGKLIDRNYGNISVAIALASFYDKKGEVNKAIEVLEDNTEHDHPDPRAASKLAELYIEKGDGRKALEVLRRVDFDRGVKPSYTCPNCGYRSSLPLNYCSNCFKPVSFERSYEKSKT